MGHGRPATTHKRYLVIRNGRGIFVDGSDMSELNAEYDRAAANRKASGAAMPAFSTLGVCDHEGETGKLCILDAENSPASVRSYYGAGFVD